jgi:small-conductance mechanosensitive channel
MWFSRARRARSSVLATTWLAAWLLSTTAGLARAQSPEPAAREAFHERYQEPERLAATVDARADVAPADAVVADAAAAAAPLGPELPVRLGDKVVFTIRASHGKTSADERARAASAALERLRDASGGDGVSFRFEVASGVAVVYGGSAPILQLYPDDATAAGDSSLHVHAASVTDRIADAFRGERRRKATISTALSLSLLVLSGLLVLWLVRKATYLIDRGRRWLKDNPQRVPAFRVLSLELVRPASVHRGTTVALTLARVLTQVGFVYGWILLALSLFDTTRGYGERLTGYVLSPLAALIGRIGIAIPIALVATVALIAVLILLRFVRLFFVSVAQGDTPLSLVPPDVAIATGVLVRAGIVVVVLLLASPLITGNDDGSLSRAGLGALLAVAVACTPVLACVAAGMPVVYGRRLQPGDHVEIGARGGVVRTVDLLDVKLVDEAGCEVRVPHLLGLFQSTRVLGKAPLGTVTVCIDPRARQSEVRALLLERARRFGGAATVTLEQLDARAARYRITAPVDAAAGEDLACAIADTLSERGVKLAGGDGLRPL